MSESDSPLARFQYDGQLYPTFVRALRAAYWDYVNTTPLGFAFDGSDEEMQAFFQSGTEEELEALVHGDALSEALQGAVFCDGIAVYDHNTIELLGQDLGLLELCMTAMTEPPVYVVRGEEHEFLETALLACFLDWNGGELATAKDLKSSEHVEDLRHWLQNIIVVDGIRINDWTVEHLTPHEDPLIELLYAALTTLLEED